MKDRNFEQLYQYIEENYTYELEKLRKELIRCIIITIIVLLPIVLLMCGIVCAITQIWELGVFVFIAWAMYAESIWVKYNKRYQIKYKENVIKNFVKIINKELNYENINNNKLEKDYREAKFRNNQYNKFESNDYIYGCIDGAVIEISDVVLKGKSKSDHSETITYASTFSCSQISKNIPQEIKILNEDNQIKMEKNKVELDSEEFERSFNVFSDSRILVMQILTHDIMEDIVQFYNNCGIDFEIVIKGKKIYIGYNVGDIFEGKIKKKSTNKESLWNCYNTLNFAVNLTLKINKILEEKDV